MAWKRAERRAPLGTVLLRTLKWPDELSVLFRAESTILKIGRFFEPKGRRQYRRRDAIGGGLPSARPQLPERASFQTKLIPRKLMMLLEKSPCTRPASGPRLMLYGALLPSNTSFAMPSTMSLLSSY